MSAKCTNDLFRWKLENIYFSHLVPNENAGALPFFPEKKKKNVLKIINFFFVDFEVECLIGDGKAVWTIFKFIFQKLL